jgi:thioredoxin-dependent adenylylsulfate APS reductase
MTPALEHAAQALEAATAQDVLRWAYAEFPRIALVASFQAEASVLIDMASTIAGELDVVTLDTGRLPEETFEIMDRLRVRYGFRLHVVTPDPDDVAALVQGSGPNLFYESVALRHACCEVRKTRPLERALHGYDAWITGLRRDQSATRAATPVVGADSDRDMVKVAPLATWTRDDVWGYIREHRVPSHPLYERGYTSIGCEPCTRPVRPGEDERAGRWWWERGEVKECGLHWSQEGKLIR